MTNNKNTKQALIFLVAGLFTSLLLIQPFNIFCRTTNKCQPIILSYYFPENLGVENFELFFETKSSQNNIIIEPLGRSAILLAGEKATINYRIVNNSKQDIKIRPRPYIEPQEAKQYIKFYECLCDREHKIKAGQEVILSVKFVLNRKIEDDEAFKYARIINIGYQIK